VLEALRHSPQRPRAAQACGRVLTTHSAHADGTTSTLIIDRASASYTAGDSSNYEAVPALAEKSGFIPETQVRSERAPNIDAKQSLSQCP